VKKAASAAATAEAATSTGACSVDPTIALRFWRFLCKVGQKGVTVQQQCLFSGVFSVFGLGFRV